MRFEGTGVTSGGVLLRIPFGSRDVEIRPLDVRSLHCFDIAHMEGMERKRKFRGVEGINNDVYFHSLVFSCVLNSSSISLFVDLGAGRSKDRGKHKSPGKVKGSKRFKHLPSFNHPIPRKYHRNSKRVCASPSAIV